MLRYRQIESLEADGGALRLRGVAVRYGEETGPPRLPFRERIDGARVRRRLTASTLKLNSSALAGNGLLARTGAGLTAHRHAGSLAIRGRLAVNARS